MVGLICRGRRPGEAMHHPAPSPGDSAVPPPSVPCSADLLRRRRGPTTSGTRLLRESDLRTGSIVGRAADPDRGSQYADAGSGPVSGERGKRVRVSPTPATRADPPPSSAARHPSGLDGMGDDAGAAVQAELLHGAGLVRLDRLDAHVEPRGDLPVGVARGRSAAAPPPRGRSASPAGPDRAAARRGRRGPCRRGSGRGRCRRAPRCGWRGSGRRPRPASARSPRRRPASSCWR